MIKIKSLNKNWFNKNKKIVLITGVILGTVIVGNTLSYKDHKHPYDPNIMNDKNPEIIYSDYNGEDIEIVTFMYSPSNIYRLRIFTGKNPSTHYRIEVGREGFEYTDWFEIPEHGLITIERKDFSDNQYGKKFFIRFGTYDSKLDKIVYKTGHYNSNVKSIFNTDCSLEEITEQLAKLIMRVSDEFQ